MIWQSNWKENSGNEQMVPLTNEIMDHTDVIRIVLPWIISLVPTSHIFDAVLTALQKHLQFLGFV